MSASNNILSAITASPGIHPRDLRQKWQLTCEKLAALLGRDRRTITRYLKDEIQPPENIKTMCWLLDYYLTAENGEK